MLRMDKQKLLAGAAIVMMPVAAIAVSSKGFWDVVNPATRSVRNGVSSILSSSDPPPPFSDSDNVTEVEIGVDFPREMVEPDDLPESEGRKALEQLKQLESKSKGALEVFVSFVKDNDGKPVCTSLTIQVSEGAEVPKSLDGIIEIFYKEFRGAETKIIVGGAWWKSAERVSDAGSSEVMPTSG